MKLAVTIDTEADGQWEHGSPLSTRNVGFWEPFHELCGRHGVTPTYLLTCEIMEDARARELLTRWSASGSAELGTHLHVWSTPPYLERDGLRFNDVTHAFASQIPTDLLREKTAELTRQFEAAFGRRPTSHRSGRFGFDQRSADFLHEEHYVVDSSVSPLWSWRKYPGLGGEGGPDFTCFDPDPFLIDLSGDRRLLEVPVTILPTYELLRRHRWLLDLYQTLPARAARKVFLSRWLRPQPMWMTPDPRLGPDDLLKLWRCAEAIGLDVVVMMFHSSELMPGGSPFRPDAASVKELLACLDVFFAGVAREGGEAATLTAAAEELLDRRDLVVKTL